MLWGLVAVQVPASCSTAVGWMAACLSSRPFEIALGSVRRCMYALTPAAVRCFPTRPPAHSPSTPSSPPSTRPTAGRLRAQRLTQMQQAAEARARLQAAGHGGLVDVPVARLLREAEASGSPLVCHLAFEGSPLDDELDEHLAQLAHRYLGTRFVRTCISLRSTLHLRLRTPPGPGESGCEWYVLGHGPCCTNSAPAAAFLGSCLVFGSWGLAASCLSVPPLPACVQACCASATAAWWGRRG